MYSKCEVSPRRMQPMAMSASYLPELPIFLAAMGISNEPGTRTTSICFPSAPPRSRASSAPASSRSVMKLLNRLTTMPKRNPAPLNSPRISLCSIFALISAPRGPSGLPLCPVVRRHRACGYALVSFTNVEVWHPGVSSGGCRAPLFPLKLCRALLEKRSSTLAHIFGGAAKPEQRRFQEQPFFLRHLHAVLDGLHCVLHCEGGVGDDLFGQRFGGGHQLRRPVNMAHQGDAQRLFRRDPLARQAKLVHRPGGSYSPTGGVDGLRLSAGPKEIGRAHLCNPV